MDPKSDLVLYVPKGAAEGQAILCDPAPEAENVENGERLTRARAADLLGVRRAELDELADAGLLVVRQDGEGKGYVRASDFKRFLGALVPVPFVEVGAEGEGEASEEDWGDEEEEAVPTPQKAKPAAKAVAAVAEEQEADAADLGAVTVTGPAAAVASFLRGLFGGGQVEEAERVEEEAESEPEPVERSNPSFGFGKSRGSGRRSGR